MTMQPEAERSAIQRMGQALGPDILTAVKDLYRRAQDELAACRVASWSDIIYGPDPRQCLDVYRPTAPGSPLPVLVWVHGGGFLRGEKASTEHPYNAHVGRWAASSGFVGIVINYRLAPNHLWPAGRDDIGLALEWVRSNVKGYGGDPERIIIAGTSAGATHIAASFAQNDRMSGVCGAVLLSALYGITPLDQRDMLYYGDVEAYDERRPLDAAVATAIPLLVVGAEYDPPRFQEELLGFLSERLKRHGKMPRTVFLSGHNHFSLACHLGTADKRLTDEILAFSGDALGGVE